MIMMIMNRMREKEKEKKSWNTDEQVDEQSIKTSDPYK